ncbi:MAG: hypothetical protein ACTSQW_04410 [Promethearchaeota archaeon]
MNEAKEKLGVIVGKINASPKAQSVFITNVAGNDVNWEMSFQFNLDKEKPYYLEVKNQAIILSDGTKSDAVIVMSGEPEAIGRICEGKGDFTHAISREQITLEKGKVMDVIRLTRAITIVLKNK